MREASEIAVREALSFLAATPAFEAVMLVAFRDTDAAVLRDMLAAAHGKKRS